MKLRKYLKQNNITHKKFAEYLEVTPNYLSSIVAGKKPSKWLAKSIEYLTAGQVKAKSLMRQGLNNAIKKECQHQERCTEKEKKQLVL